MKALYFNLLFIIYDLLSSTVVLIFIPLFVSTFLYHGLRCFQTSCIYNFFNHLSSSSILHLLCSLLFTLFVTFLWALYSFSSSFGIVESIAYKNIGLLFLEGLYLFRKFWFAMTFLCIVHHFPAYSTIVSR